MKRPALPEGASRPLPRRLAAAAVLTAVAWVASAPTIGAPAPLSPPAQGRGAALAPKLHWPVDCRLGETCVVQQYPDLDPGPGVIDPGCGGRSYDGHEGVDIRLRSVRDLSGGVAVRAAADGVVLRVRTDGRPRRGAHCGAGVLIAHPGGLQTQYCHLAPGSPSVRVGQSVAAGAPIGRIGLTGRTSFPHLHFTVRQDGVVIDPFSGAAVGARCGRRSGLWADPSLAYEPAAFLDAGFSDQTPLYADISQGADAGADVPARDAGALVFWTRALGLAAGDRLKIELRGPGGEVIARHHADLDGDRALQFLYAGRKAAGVWPAGRYVGRARLMRGGAVLLDRSWPLPLGPADLTLSQ